MSVKTIKHFLGKRLLRASTQEREKTNQPKGMCGPRKYPYHPHEKDLSYDPLPSGFSKPKNLLPLPSGISKILAHPLEILPSLIEVKKLAVFFFIACQIFYVFSVEFHFTLGIQQISEFLMRSSHKQIVEKVLGHTQIKCQVASEI